MFKKTLTNGHSFTNHSINGHVYNYHAFNVGTN